MAYSDKVLDHYENPRNVGSFAKDDDDVGTGMVGAPACGDVMKLQIGSARTASSRTPSSRPTAAARRSRRRRWSPNGSRARRSTRRMAIKNTQIAEELALPPVKIHCSILAEDAIKAAVADYRKKHGDGDEHAQRRARTQASAAAPTRSRRRRHGSHADRNRGEARRRLSSPSAARASACAWACARPAARASPTSSSSPTRSKPEDFTFREPRRQVVVDPKSLPYLDGTELDFAREGLNEGFKFNNPNVKDECGCGESSTSRDRDPHAAISATVSRDCCDAVPLRTLPTAWWPIA